MLPRKSVVKWHVNRLSRREGSIRTSGSLDDILSFFIDYFPNYKCSKVVTFYRLIQTFTA